MTFIDGFSVTLESVIAGCNCTCLSTFMPPTKCVETSALKLWKKLVEFKRLREVKTRQKWKVGKQKQVHLGNNVLLIWVVYFSKKASTLRIWIDFRAKELGNMPDRATMRLDCVSVCITFRGRHVRYTEG